LVKQIDEDVHDDDDDDDDDEIDNGTATRTIHGAAARDSPTTTTPRLRIRHCSPQVYNATSNTIPKARLVAHPDLFLHSSIASFLVFTGLHLSISSATTTTTATTRHDTTREWRCTGQQGFLQ
jgi:hypothetical protein